MAEVAHPKGHEDLVEEVVDELVEHHSVDYVPRNERYSRPIMLLPYWFSVNACAATVTTGAIGLALGLSLRNTILAIIVGNILGTLFMAYHSAQGPKLGLPQMIQSRAQFGFFGASLPNLLVIVTLGGYFITFGVLGGQALSSMFHIPVWAGLAINNAVVWIIVGLGYQAIHVANRVMAVVSLAVMIALFVEVGSKIGHSAYHPTLNTAGVFLLMVSIVVSWQVTYAPLVSEFSRYLPDDTKTARTVAYTYIGSAGGAILFMTLGAMAGTIAFNQLNNNTSEYLGHLLPMPIGLALLLIFLGLTAAVCENVYGVYTTTMATISPDGTKLSPRITRPLVAGIVAVAGGFIEAAISAHFLTDLTNFLSFILYLLVPWTAINLVDYYLVRRGKYDVGQILDRHGKYGRFTWPAIAIYLVATAVQIPFMDTSIYEGPVASHLLGGGDIAWIVGLTTAGGLYYAACRLGLVPAGREVWPRKAAAPAPVSPAPTVSALFSETAD